jgi:type IV secretory pathway VirB6-like protein
VQNGTRYNCKFDAYNYAGVGLSFLHDDAADLSYRITPGVHAGRYVVLTEMGGLSFEAGLGSTSERMAGIASTNLSFSTGLTLKIGNQLFRGFADFEDRSPAFRDFVIALHKARMNVTPPCKFFAGVTPLSFWLNASFLGSVMIVLAILIILFAGSIPAVALIKLTILIIMLPIAINRFRKDKPRQYEGNTRAIPSPRMSFLHKLNHKKRRGAPMNHPSV